MWGSEKMASQTKLNLIFEILTLVFTQVYIR